MRILLVLVALGCAVACTARAAAAPETPEERTVALANGDVLRGVVLESGEAGVVLEHPVLGQLVLAPEQLAVAWDVPPESGSAPSAEPEPTAAPPAPEPEAAEAPRGLFGTRLLAGWERTLGVGVSGAQGASETLDLNATLIGAYEDDKRRWNFDGGYFLSLVESDTQKNQAHAELVRDWLLPESRWFFFAKGRYDYDTFRNWTHRVSGFVGPGYTFFEGERFDLRGRVGVGANRTFGGDNQEIVPEGQAGLETAWRPLSGHEITASSTLFKALTEGTGFRVLSKLDWKIELGEVSGLGLLLGVANEYDQQSETDQLDLNYYANLTYGF